MAIPLTLGALGAVAYYLNEYNLSGMVPANEDVGVQDPSAMQLEFQSTGITMGAIRPFYAAFTNLNEAFKPFSAPFQTATHDLARILNEFGTNLAYEQTNAPAFYFKTPIAQLPLTTADQSNPNVIVPDSWQAPPGAKTLVQGPRVYMEYKNQELYEETFKNRFTTSGYNTDAGMPTETEVHVDPPDAGPINIEFNPWGPGGLLQNLFNNGLNSRTLKQGADLSSIIGPPMTGALFNQ